MTTTYSQSGIYSMVPPVCYPAILTTTTVLQESQNVNATLTNGPTAATADLRLRMCV